jgi:hypothetical protein
MSVRRVRIVLLCEDSQHEAFVTRFLAGMGWNKREFYVMKSPTGRGSAEQWVKKEFPDELKVYRQRSQRAASGLVAMIDADVRDVQDRIDEFKNACVAKQIPFRTNGEAVAIAVPKRNIETWIHYLNGQQVDEQHDYPKLGRERDCKPAVDNMVRFCRTTGLPGNAPASLAAACDEYRNRIASLI